MADEKEPTFEDWDNSDPPQWWLWAGEPGDESAEPLRRLPEPESED